MKILVTDSISEEGITYLRQQSKFDVSYQPDLSPDSLLSEVRDADALIVRSKTKVTSNVIKAAKCLRVIGRAGAGVDNIDQEAATRKGVVIMNTPGGNSISVAEHAFALMLSLARKIPLADTSLRSGNWNKSSLVGQELQNKTLGILGLGKIGALLAQRAQAFHMKVVAFDPFVSEDHATSLGVQLAKLNDLFSQSDFVSLHLPLNEKTKGLINTSTLALMKKKSFLINTSRGELVVEADLANALESGHLSGAALDVFEEEPEIHASLLSSPKTIVTPHIAGSTVEAQSKVGYEIAVQISNYLNDEVILNAINFPSMTPKEVEDLQHYVRLGEKLGSFIGQICKIRISGIGIRYYGELSEVNYKPVSNYILKSILKPILTEEINEVNARNYAKERGIAVIETVSSRERSYSNLISIQLRSPQQMEWIEGAVLRQGALRLVSLDGIPVEAHLGEHILLIRNQDTPGVIGQVGTVLGNAKINIASFVLGKGQGHPHAVGIVNTDSSVPEEVLDKIREIPAVQFVLVVQL